MVLGKGADPGKPLSLGRLRVRGPVAAAITSLSEAASNFGVATRMKGEVPTSVIGIKSFCRS